MRSIYDAMGCFYPLTPRGISCLVGDLPWHYGTEYLLIQYRASPDAVAEYLPDPLEPGKHAGVCYVAFSKWWSLAESARDMATINPERTQYREAAIWTGCSFRGVEGQMCLHVWVDNDFSMARGWFMGFPKRLGQIYMTEMHPHNPAMGPIRPGSRLKGIVSAHTERLITGAMTVKQRVSRTELPWPFGLPVFHIRHYPSIVPGEPPSVLELVRLGAENVQLGDEIWSGDGELDFLSSELEEHDGLAPREVLGAYRFSSGYTFPGGEVVHRWI